MDETDAEQARNDQQSDENERDRRDTKRREGQRRDVVNQRTGMDRRARKRDLTDDDRRAALDRRRGPGRRRSDARRSAEEGEMNDEQFSFLMAINEYKRVNKRPFPTWTEVLDIIHAMGYRKVAEPENIQ